MRYTKYIGIDPSLTGTAYICLNNKGEIETQELIKTSKDDIIEKRLSIIINRIQTLIEKSTDHYFYPSITYIEGLSFGSVGNVRMQLSGLHFGLRLYFYNIDSRYDSIPTHYEIIPPTTLKKFITKKGNAKKELMLLEVYKRWGIEWKDNNLCDGYSLARMALELENK